MLDGLRLVSRDFFDRTGDRIRLPTLRQELNRVLCLSKQWHWRCLIFSCSENSRRDKEERPLPGGHQPFYRFCIRSGRIQNHAAIADSDSLAKVLVPYLPNESIEIEVKKTRHHE